MPLSKLENFIKNTEGRILYVNPSDIDSTDSLDNQGNSLTKPFKTIQRAMLESARFSYVRGKDNDIIDKTTILLFPGEHLIDNRPGYGIVDNLGAKAVSPAGAQSVASTEFGLTLNSNFDLSQEDNDLYKFLVRLNLACCVLFAISTKYYFVKCVKKVSETYLELKNIYSKIQYFLAHILLIILFLSLFLLLFENSKTFILIVEWNYFFAIFLFYLLYSLSWRKVTI